MLLACDSTWKPRRPLTQGPHPVQHAAQGGAPRPPHDAALAKKERELALKDSALVLTGFEPQRFKRLELGRHLQVLAINSMRS